MIPGFLVAFVALCASMVTLIVVPIIGLFFKDWLQRFIDEHLGKDFPFNATQVLLYYWFGSAIAAGLFELELLYIALQLREIYFISFPLFV